jgi:ATP-binding cassette subfamily B protein
MTALAYLKKCVPVVVIIFLILCVQAACRFMTPLFMGRIIDVGIMRGGVPAGSVLPAGADAAAVQTMFLLKTGALMLAFVLGAALMDALSNLIASRASAKIARNLRQKVFENALSFSGAEVNYFTPSSLITRCTNDIQVIQSALFTVLKMTLFAPVVGAGSIIMVARSRASGLWWIIAIGIAAIACVIITVLILTTPRYSALQKLIDRLNLISREILTGMPVVRAFGREETEEKRFDAINQNLSGTQCFVNRVVGLVLPSANLAAGLIMAGILWFSGQLVGGSGILVGDVVACIMYSMMIISAFGMLSLLTLVLPRANESAKRVNEAIAAKAAVRDNLSAVCVPQNPSVEFRNVSFAYPGAESPAVSNISFIAEPGSWTAIIGGTGSGKSTLVNLLVRAYDATAGSILIGGVDIREMSLETVREALGFVPQKPAFFSGTISSNIKFNGKEIADGAMRNAADISASAPFIEGKEGKYESPVAQGGTNVSGGQRQRLAIARALAKEPPILVFDDSFSALDYKTDAAVRGALRKKAPDAAVIVVAQRVSTIMHAARIVVLDNGEIAGIGTHEELLRDCAVYREIVQSQSEADA